MNVVWSIGKQLLEQLRYLHETERLIHGHLDDEHISIENKKLVKLVQLQPSKFVMKSFWDSKINLHIKNRSVCRTVNLVFAGRDANSGQNFSRRDDLQSLSYLLIWLARGDLPWEDISFCTKRTAEKRLEAVYKIKTETAVESLCNGLPSFLEKFFRHCRCLQFNELPDYDFLIGKFTFELETRKREFDTLTEIILVASTLPRRFVCDTLNQAINLTPPRSLPQKYPNQMCSNPYQVYGDLLRGNNIYARPPLCGYRQLPLIYFCTVQPFLEFHPFLLETVFRCVVKYVNVEEKTIVPFSFLLRRSWIVLYLFPIAEGNQDSLDIIYLTMGVKLYKKKPSVEFLIN